VAVLDGPAFGRLLLDEAFQRVVGVVRDAAVPRRGAREDAATVAVAGGGGVRVGGLHDSVEFVVFVEEGVTVPVGDGDGPAHLVDGGRAQGDGAALPRRLEADLLQPSLGVVVQGG